MARVPDNRVDRGMRFREGARPRAPRTGLRRGASQTLDLLYPRPRHGGSRGRDPSRAAGFEDEDENEALRESRC